jgi:hydrogenase maturation protease
MGAGHANTSHESNARELLAIAKVLDELPDRVFIVGVEPQTIATSFGLSKPVRRALPIAADRIRDLLAELNDTSRPLLRSEISSVD